ncbi:hypothetical protein KQX54_007803 [Cotesia glomerata]|uniref:Uncharacterized protein n=1 Tax=Cotesia glomerata TaxID=32391 RepID=A0AAV7I1B0_COTGL|nr:hypothetical protein KQX54_007803 [Cotesia glomerata]
MISTVGSRVDKRADRSVGIGAWGLGDGLKIARRQSREDESNYGVVELDVSPVDGSQDKRSLAPVGLHYSNRVALCPSSKVMGNGEPPSRPPEYATPRPDKTTR